MWWRLKYRFGGKEKLLSLGTYPTVSLSEARNKAEAARSLKEKGIDPSAERQRAKLEEAIKGADTFQTLALEWHQKNAPKWTPAYSKSILDRLAHEAFPLIGHKPITTVTKNDLRRIIKVIADRKRAELARKVLQYIRQVFIYAISHDRAETNPADYVRDSLPVVVTRHFPTITDPVQIGGLLRAIDGCTHSFVVKCALRLAPLVFVRPGELQKAEWGEIDTKAALWRIPAEKMKMKRPHLVPLSRQALTILADIHPLTGRGQYIFPSERGRDRPISNGTINAALEVLGFTGDQIVCHGFRHMASTCLYELGWPSDAIERQLAHVEQNKIKGTYNKAEHLEKRREMMQAWADYLDGLREGAKVIPIKREAHR